MLLRLIEDGKPGIFQQQIYGLPVIIARIDDFFAANLIAKCHLCRMSILAIRVVRAAIELSIFPGAENQGAAAAWASA